MFCKKCGNMLKLEKSKDDSIKRFCDCKEKKQFKQEKPDIDKTHIEEIIRNIDNGFVFTKITELETLTKKLPRQKERDIINDFISDVKGGIYVVVSCPNSYNVKTVYVHINNINLEYTSSRDSEDAYIDSKDIPILSKYIPCIIRDECNYKSYNHLEGAYCVFRADIQKIKKAKKLLETKLKKYK
ncbi:hypothetical protein GF374_00395 [Candidatus Woesearchaeota archaeon]|nr:hypothetical protein [Candidatus Woesearchaeota archaeon]